jgi:hypothetical protein
MFIALPLEAIALTSMLLVSTPAPVARPAVHCDGAIQHPIQVRAMALDPLLHGGVVRVRVTTRARHALERGEVRLVSAGGATLVGARRVTFGRLSPGAEAAAEFAVRLPAEGRRFPLEFRVTGGGGGGLESRMATLNLLPDGPADPGRLVITDTGARVVAPLVAGSTHRTQKLLKLAP